MYWTTSDRCTGVLVYRCIGVLVYRRYGVLMYWCTGVGVLVYWCTGVPVYLCTDVLVYYCIGVPVYGCTCFWALDARACARKCACVRTDLHAECEPVYMFTAVQVYTSLPASKTAVSVYWCTDVMVY